MIDAGDQVQGLRLAGAALATEPGNAAAHKPGPPLKAASGEMPQFERARLAGQWICAASRKRARRRQETNEASANR